MLVSRLVNLAALVAWYRAGANACQVRANSATLPASDVINVSDRAEDRDLVARGCLVAWPFQVKNDATGELTWASDMGSREDAAEIEVIELVGQVRDGE